MHGTLPKPGAVVVIRHERWRVLAASITGDATRIDATRLGPGTPASVTFFAPFDQIDVGGRRHRPRRVRRQRWQAALSGVGAWAEHVDLPLAALSADITVWPYQLEPLFAMRAGRRRVLIADAVGLGKTIQAGLIVAELIRRREAARILIAAPSHLCRQWREELETRFHLTPRVADAAALAGLVSGLPRQTNPWSIEGVWIGSLDFLKQPHILNSLPPDPWDLVILDEAHHATGQSDRRDAAEQLAGRARRVLLLTATPLSGLDDGRVLQSMGALSDKDSLTVFRRTRADVGIPARRRIRDLRVTPSEAERRALDLVDAFAGAAIAAAATSTADATHLLVAVLAKRALSTFAALAISADRRLAHLSGLPAEATDATQTAFDFGDADDAALTLTIGMAADRERSWMRRLRAAALAAARHSRKIARLLTLIARTREPVIVFTEFRDSLEAVASALSRRSHTFVRAHGGLSPAELQAALDTFRRGHARILVATDVASQGLNLHHSARWVIHLDLPWNPIRLEQRAGRVDRMGQTRDVHVTRLVMTHARDRAFVDRLAERAEAAASHAVLFGDTRWRRRARAAAVVVERRRRWAGLWRGVVARGRPLACARRDRVARVWEVDIAGAETLILHSGEPVGFEYDSTLGRRMRARVRRVSQLVVARACRAGEVERALGTRSKGAESQPALPGALTADDVLRRDAGLAAISRARRACDARIAALEQRARSGAAAASAHLLFLAD